MPPPVAVDRQGERPAGHAGAEHQGEDRHPRADELGHLAGLRRRAGRPRRDRLAGLLRPARTTGAGRPRVAGGRLPRISAGRLSREGRAVLAGVTGATGLTADGGAGLTGIAGGLGTRAGLPRGAGAVLAGVTAGPTGLLLAGLLVTGRRVLARLRVTRIAGGRRIPGPVALVSGGRAGLVRRLRVRAGRGRRVRRGRRCVRRRRRRVRRSGVGRAGRRPRGAGGVGPERRWCRPERRWCRTRRARRGTARRRGATARRRWQPADAAGRSRTRSCP